MSDRKIQTIVDFNEVGGKNIADSATFLNSDFSITEGNMIRMVVTTDDEYHIQYTRNGTDYHTVNSGDAQVIDGSYFYRFPVSAGDLFNVKIQESAIIQIWFKAELWLEA